MITVYGLKSCDTCRKALQWLEQQGIVHRFHDVRSDGLDKATVRRWVRHAGWETLLNRRGATWRKLPESERENIDADRAVTLMHAHPALIKRPVFEMDRALRVGFTEDVRAALKNAWPPR